MGSQAVTAAVRHPPFAPFEHDARLGRTRAVAALTVTADARRVPV